MTPQWRSRLTAILLVVSGAALGLATEHAIILHRHGLQHQHRQTVLPSHAVILSALDDVLKLTPAQHDSIDKVLRRHQKEIDDAWLAIHRQMATNMKDVHNEIAHVLTPDQINKFHDWLRSQQH